VSKIRVTVWNEGIHEKKSEKVRGVYPEGIHGAIAGQRDRDPAGGVRGSVLCLQAVEAAVEFFG